MELKEFTNKVQKALSEFYGNEAEVKEHQIYKNNDILLYGICVLEKDRNIAPTIYLNHFHDRYENGVPFGEIIKEIIQIIDDNRVERNLNIDFFMDYEKVKKRLVLRLIHRENNKELLKDVPYQSYLDLAVVCHCVLESEEIGSGAILIHKNHMHSWNIDEETLFQDAYQNSPCLEPYQILPMSEMVKDILENTIAAQVEQLDMEEEKKIQLVQETVEKMAQEMEERNIPMYVLSNAKKYYGAACILYPGVLEKIEQLLQSDYYILPSSVHEIIFLGKQEGMNEDTLNEMIEEINLTQVAKEEWLSNHAYLYRKNEKMLEAVAN